MIRSKCNHDLNFSANTCGYFGVNRLRICLLVLAAICFTKIGYSQVIRGTVLDKNTDEVIPFASIYFSGTSFGTTSNDKGYFELNLPKDFSNPLTISSVGFYSATLTDFSTDEILTVKLEPKTYNLLEVEVSATESRNIRKRYFPVFRTEFLGKKFNPKSCKIINEGDIMLQYDRNKKVLKAFATRPIQIQNEALGYKISYFLDRFEYSTANHSLTYVGNYSFTPITASNRIQQEKFDKSRSEAYFGSRMHLFRSLWDGNLEASGFVIVDSIGTMLPVDKLVLAKRPFATGNPQKYLVKHGLMLVWYKGFSNQTKMLLENDLIPFDSNGYFDPFGIVWEGKMGNQRISDLLPFEYAPVVSTSGKSIAYP
jgi:hypothetical protein